jgi:Uncharacterized phage-associated protein
MASVFDVAKYILIKKGPMSTMKLQKLCYYSQSWALVWDGAPLFDEDFEAWMNGPVCPQLFSVHRGKYSVCSDEIKGNSRHLEKEQKETIEAVLDYYGDKSPQWLSDLTHLEDPWKLARNGCPDGAKCDHVISKESMGIYYESLK